MTLVDRLRAVGCDREPFTPEHATCICRLTNEAAREIEQLSEAATALIDEIRRSGTHECWKMLANKLSD